MQEDDEREPDTLGRRLTAAGEHMRARHRPAYAWAAGFAPVLARAEDLSLSWPQRFERTESGKAVPMAPPRPELPFSTSPPAPPNTEDAVQPPLPPSARARLREVAGPGADAASLHVTPDADATAQEHHADAVTIGSDVHVRAGRFEPHTAEGFALLAHEASHVSAALAPGASARRSTAAGRAEEETAARTVERLARAQPWPGPTARSGPGSGSGRPESGRPGVAPGDGTGPRPGPGAAGHNGGPLTGPGTPATSNRATATPSWPPPTQTPLAQTPLAQMTQAQPPPQTAAPTSSAAVPMRADTDRPEAAAPMPTPSPAFDVEALREQLIGDLMHRLRTDYERGG